MPSMLLRSQFLYCSAANVPPCPLALSSGSLLSLSSNTEEESSRITTMAYTTTDNNSKPKSMSRAKEWTAEVENLFRFQEAGYRDELEYIQVKQGASIDKWPETGFVRKLQRRDNTFYYYNKKRECEDCDVHKVKVYAY